MPVGPFGCRAMVGPELPLSCNIEVFRVCLGDRTPCPAMEVLVTLPLSKARVGLAEERQIRGRTDRTVRHLIRHPLFWLGGGMLCFLLAFSFLGPLLFSYRAGETAIDVAQQFLPPSPSHLLGTNVLGQDELAQMMIGGQAPIITGFVATFVAALLGIAIGLVSGFAGDVGDSFLMRLTDIFLSIPQVVPILLLDALFQASTEVLVIVVALTSWPAMARIVRARTLALRHLPFMEAAHASGAKGLRLLLRHLVPNMLDDIILATTSLFANVVLIMAITTFVGLGLPPPWNWATMFAANLAGVFGGQWWTVFPPGIAFAILLLSVSYLGEALRQALNPQQAREVRQ